MRLKTINSLIAVVLTVLSLGFTSCGDDNDEPSVDPQPVLPAKIAIGYSLELGDGWWDFFDIEVTYTTATGAIETKTIQKGWTYVGKVNYQDALTEYSFTAKATPKADLPEIDENTKYNFDKDAKAYAFSVNDKDEQVEILSSKNNSTTMTVAGANMAKWLELHTNLGAGTITLNK